MAGSELKKDSSNAPWVRGVCKVITKNPQKEGANYGTGFLLKFSDTKNSPVRGFLTCYHVATCDDITLEEPNKINLYFQSLDQTSNLTEIQKPGCGPILNQNTDFYFMMLSNEFCEEMVNKHGVQFIESTESITDDPIRVPQHPGGKERHIATATIDPNWKVEKKQNWHRASTERGSSGSPLLQKQGDEMRVIGINRGYDPNRELNGAVSIYGIINQIKSKI